VTTHEVKRHRSSAHTHTHTHHGMRSCGPGAHARSPPQPAIRPAEDRRRAMQRDLSSRPSCTKCAATVCSASGAWSSLGEPAGGRHRRCRVLHLPRQGSRTLAVQLEGPAMVALLCLMMRCDVSGADGGNFLSLNMEGPATTCRAATSWVRRDCQVRLLPREITAFYHVLPRADRLIVLFPAQMLASDSIPTLSAGLFNIAGAPCCGQDQVAVRLKVTKGAVEYVLTGFSDKDSTPGAAGSRMTVDFANLKLVDRTAVGEFTVTVSAFYLGLPVAYTVLSTAVFAVTLLSRWFCLQWRWRSKRSCPAQCMQWSTNACCRNRAVLRCL